MCMKDEIMLIMFLFMFVEVLQSIAMNRLMWHISRLWCVCGWKICREGAKVS